MTPEQAKKFVIFIMVVATLGFVMNFGLDGGPTGFATLDYASIDSIVSVDASQLKYDLIAGETKQAIFYVKNHLADKPLEVDLEVSGKAANFISLQERHVIVPPNSIRAVEMLITASLEAIPQVYFGDIVVSAEGRGKLLQIQVNVKKRIQEALEFRLEPQKLVINPGEELGLALDITDMGTESAAIQVEMRMYRGSSVIWETTDDIGVETKLTKNYVVKVPETAEPGVYNIDMKISARMGQQYGVFERKKQVTVERILSVEAPAKTKNTLLWWIVSTIIMVGLLLTGSALVRQEVITLPRFMKVLKVHPDSGKDSKQYIREGFSYIIDERGTRTSYQTIRMLHAEGFKVLCITRLNPKLLTEEVPEFRLAAICWLTTQEGQGMIGPTDIEGIYNAIDKAIVDNPRSAIIVDGLSFLHLNAGFNQVMLLLQYIKDRISAAQSIFIAPLNSKALSKLEIEQIAEEMKILDGRREILLAIYRSDDNEAPDTAAKIPVTRQLFEYVKKYSDSGINEDRIIAALVAHGWSKATVKHALDLAKYPDKYAEELKGLDIDAGQLAPVGKMKKTVDQVEKKKSIAASEAQEPTDEGSAGIQLPGATMDEEPAIAEDDAPFGEAYKPEAIEIKKEKTAVKDEEPSMVKEQQTIPKAAEKAEKKSEKSEFDWTSENGVSGKIAAKSGQEKGKIAKPELENIREPKIVDKIETEYDQIKEEIESSMSGNQKLASLDMQLKLLSQDLQVADITDDPKDIEKVKKKLDEIKRKINAKG